MEKVMAQIAEAEDRQTISKSVIKSEIKSMKKVSKLYRALQIYKKNSRYMCRVSRNYAIIAHNGSCKNSIFKTRGPCTYFV